MTSFLRRLKGAEWVCLGFGGLAATRIFLSPNPLDWTQVPWQFFPKLDLFFIACGVWILKFSRPYRWMATVNLFLLVLCFYGFAGRIQEPLFPIQALLGQSALIFLEKYRWIPLAAILFFVGKRGFQKRRKLKVALVHARIIAPLFVMICLYPLVPLLIQGLGMPDRDAELAAIDTWIFGGSNPLLLAEHWIHPLVSEWMAFSYSSFGFLFSILFAFIFLKKSSRPIAQMVLMSTWIFALGYWSYSWVPAKGPLFSQVFKIPLDFYYMKEIKEALIDHVRIDRDCFPSLHTAITGLTLYIAWKQVRALFWMFLPLAISIPFACIYLRYHYVTDVLAGVGLVIGVILLGEKAKTWKSAVP